MNHEICIASCGNCCSKSILCEVCTENTLKSNGLSIDYKNRIKDLNKFSHSGSEYSNLGRELKTILKELS